MLKKEYHFIITTLKTINKNLEQKYISLDGLMKWLNLKNQSVDEIETLDYISTDSDFEDDTIEDSANPKEISASSSSFFWSTSSKLS